MKLFQWKEVREARAHSLKGGQAVHLNPDWMPNFFPNAPLVFKRKRNWVHLMDQDEHRLIATAQRLGVRVIKVSEKGLPDQHIDLCGKPAERAVQEASKGSVAQGIEQLPSKQ